MEKGIKEQSGRKKKIQADGVILSFSDQKFERSRERGADRGRERIEDRNRVHLRKRIEYGYDL